MSRFSVCKPAFNIQSPSFFAPIIEAGVTSTQRSWRVTLTLSHTQTPPHPYSPLSHTNMIDFDCVLFEW
jgi:hypothetical protein